VAAALASVNTAAAEPPSVAAKRAQAQDVLGQIREIDSQLSHAIEAFNRANVQLDRIDSDLRTNARHLVIAKRSLRNAQRHLSQRLVSLYVNGSGNSTLEVMLGAASLDDLLSRLDAVERVSDQDTRVLGEVTGFRAEAKLRKAKLVGARTAQARVVAERTQQRRSIEGQLAERQQLLGSIRDQLASLEAAERRRQERLAAQAQARVAATSVQQPVEAGETAAFEPSAVEAMIAAPPARYGGVVGIAMQYLGVPYVWGGASPSGFDCSGFLMYVYAKVGVSLPHNAAMQYQLGAAVSKDQLEPGDLVFFDGLGHNGMYIGGGQFIHAPHSGDVVKISSLSDSWYTRTWVGGKRL